jgi:hypothetical protein
MFSQASAQYQSESEQQSVIWGRLEQQVPSSVALSGEAFCVLRRNLLELDL